MPRPRRRDGASRPHGRSPALAGPTALAAAAWLLLVAPPAEAIERQHHVGLSPSLSMLKVDDKSTFSVGAGLALHYTYGIDDQWNFMAELGSSIVAADQKEDYPGAPRTRPAGVDQASAGVGYVIDVLRWVPYVCVLAGGYRLHGGTLESALILPGAAAGVGIDYQLSRHWAVGVAGRQHFLFTRMSDYPTYTTVLLRLEYMWGF